MLKIDILLIAIDLWVIYIIMYTVQKRLILCVNLFRLYDRERETRKHKHITVMRRPSFHQSHGEIRCLLQSIAIIVSHY